MGMRGRARKATIAHEIANQLRARFLRRRPRALSAEASPAPSSSSSSAAAATASPVRPHRRRRLSQVSSIRVTRQAVALGHGTGGGCSSASSVAAFSAETSSPGASAAVPPAPSPLQPQPRPLHRHSSLRLRPPDASRDSIDRQPRQHLPQPRLPLGQPRATAAVHPLPPPPSPLPPLPPASTLRPPPLLLLSAPPSPLSSCLSPFSQPVSASRPQPHPTPACALDQPPSPPPARPSDSLSERARLPGARQPPASAPTTHSSSAYRPPPSDLSGTRHGRSQGHQYSQLTAASPPFATTLPAPPASPGAAAAPSPAHAVLSAAVDPPESPRRQSLFGSRHTSLIKNLLCSVASTNDSADATPRSSVDASMVTRKVWVKRPFASATTIAIHDDDLVDDVRDLILRKYANSLGRIFDSPDLSIRICGRDQEKDRTLGPDENMARTLERYYPTGQTVDEALVIDIPRRTPKLSSPLAPPMQTTAGAFYLTEDGRPSEAGEGYFPPVVAMPPVHLSQPLPVTTDGSFPYSIAVFGTGHIPPVPSAGAAARPRPQRGHSERPRLARQHTSSPTTMPAHPPAPTGAQHIPPRLTHSRTHSSSSDHQPSLPTVKPAMPKSPGPGPEPVPARVATPPPRIASPRTISIRAKKSKKSPDYPAGQAPNLLNGTVPPISVLIVEDNPINLRLLEAFVKRLKVRWQTAMNGKEAVRKWRTGGFHLVLMDIQLPVMNGLDATREIRRLERVNSIGVFSSSPGSLLEDVGPGGEVKEQDRLGNLSLFKSPVIIVALTASSLQSDRHEALAAGCNDFLTKPVNFVWLERKVMEWGCMQALIDFDGWRKWKDYSQQAQESEASKKTQGQMAKFRSRRNRSSLSSST